MHPLKKVKPARQVELVAVDILRSWVGTKGQVEDMGLGHEPDFKIEYLDGRTGIGEVGWHVDPRRASGWAALTRRKQHHVFDLPEDYGVWIASLQVGTNLNRLEESLPALIQQMNEKSVGKLTVDPRHPFGELQLLASALGITHLSLTNEKGRNYVFYNFEGVSGFVPDDANLIVDWIEGVLASDDFRDSWQKLLSYKRDEKHVFIMSGSRTEVGIRELLWQAAKNLPTRAPVLPGELTHIWVIGERPGSSPLFWCRATGWSTLDPYVNK